MVITPQNITDAIAMAMAARRRIAVNTANSFSQGVENFNYQTYMKLYNAVFYLTDYEVSLANQCITVDGIWEQIEVIKNNSNNC